MEVEVSKNEKPATLQVPAEFTEAMKKHKVVGFFDTLSFGHRREYCRWISSAKREETRLTRLDKAIALLKKRAKTPYGA